MKFSKIKLRLLVLLLMLLMGGCAPAYHCYPGCRVNCKYCPPCPLSHRPYDGCVCHSCAASKYLLPEPKSFEKTVLADLPEFTKEKSTEEQ